jgi:hypothetical protein
LVCVSTTAAEGEREKVMLSKMARPLIFVISLIVCNYCFAFPVDRSFSSCNGKYSIVDAGSGSAFLVSNGNKKLIHLDHSVDGGSIDKKHSLFIVYGTPRIIDAQYPQTTIVSVFKNINDPRRISRLTVGGGVYDASFSLDGKFAVVNYRFGTLIIDMHKNKSYLTDSKPLKVIKCG